MQSEERKLSREDAIALVAQRFIISMLQGKDVYEQAHNPARATTQALGMATLIVDFSSNYDIFL